jgi:hypothetical protein
MDFSRGKYIPLSGLENKSLTKKRYNAIMDYCTQHTLFMKSRRILNVTVGA